MERLGAYTERLTQQRKAIAPLPFLWLLAKHKGNLPSALEEAPRFEITSPGTARLMKAAVAAGSTDASGWASELSSYSSIFGDFVQAISATTLLGQLDFVPVPFQTKMTIVTAAPAARWVAPGEPIPMSRGSLDTTDALTERKIATLIPFTNELFHLWSPIVAANMRDAITRSVRFAVDQSLLDPSMAETLASPASLTNGIAAGPSTGGTAAQALADFGSLLASIISGGWDLSRTVIAMPPSSALHLSQLQTVSGAFAFPALTATGGNISGVPVVVTPAGALVGSPQVNVIAAIDGARVQVADEGLMTVDASGAATVQFTDAPTVSGPSVSLFQTNSTVLRVMRILNFKRAVDSGVAWFSPAY